jgi:hypothetical protein
MKKTWGKKIDLNCLKSPSKISFSDQHSSQFAQSLENSISETIFQFCFGGEYMPLGLVPSAQLKLNPIGRLKMFFILGCGCNISSKLALRYVKWHPKES